MPALTGAALALLLLSCAAMAALVWGVARWYLRGADLDAFDGPVGERFAAAAPSATGEHEAVVKLISDARRQLDGLSLKQRLVAGRKLLDELLPVPAGCPATFTPAEAGGVSAEWVLAPGADPDRRLLYIHGGGFVVGSPRSHRRLTARLAQITQGAVLAIDYRKMPEHPRKAGIEDCRSAYRWMLGHGPGGRVAPAGKVWVAGDSAGGNLTLALLAWARDEAAARGLRAPDGAVAFSPATDATLTSPTLRANARTDPMLGVIFKPLLRLPDALLLWGSWLANRMHPTHPAVSPARGDLSRLPPVLVQASSTEMLLGDARRYVNRAAAAGSPVRLQTWERMVHVWQIFHPGLAEGRQALAEVEKFLRST